MIHYDLRCGSGHDFDGWFKDSAGYETQAKAGFVQCPVCGSSQVAKQLMAPAIPKKGRSRATLPALPATPPGAPGAVPATMQANTQANTQSTGGPMPAQVLALLQRMRAEVESHCDYVGPGFAEEARKIHRGETDARGIYGEASEADAEALREEGIEVARIPWVPRADG